MSFPRRCSIALVLALMLGGGTVFAREPFTIDYTESLTNIFHTIYGNTDNPAPAVQKYLTDTMCGGFNTNLRVGAQAGAPGLVARVTGFPGRNYEPLGDFRKEVAKPVMTGGTQNDGFLYPDNATGKTTVCRPEHADTDPDTGRPAIQKTVWDDASEARIEKWFPYPYFEDPPCLWEADGNLPHFAKEVDPPHSEEKCTAFCGWVNTFTYQDCPNANLENVQVQEMDPDTGKPVNVTRRRCKANGWEDRYVCSGERKNNNPAQDAWPNCKTTCTGSACRCPGPGCVRSPDGDEYQSFFRKYSGSYQRGTMVQNVPTDVGQKNAEAACFGFYHEFSLADNDTEARDWQCALSIDNVGQLRQSQTGKGEYGLSSNLPDPNPLALPDARLPLPPDPVNDLWVPLGGAFSLLHEKLFQESYDGQLRSLLLDSDHLDDAKEKAAVQLTEVKPLAISNTLREYDDTGDLSLVHWWRDQQNAARQIFRRPAVQLLLPAKDVLGLDTSLPPFAASPAPPADENGDPRSRSVRIQVGAGEDLIGAVLTAIRIPLEEAPIRLPLPDLSATEIEAVRTAWCARYLEEGHDNCTIAETPQNLGMLLRALDQWIVYAERIRILRSALARHAGQLLTIQNEMTDPIVQALTSALTSYRAVLAEQEIIEGALLPRWREAEHIAAMLSDVTNLPYCMNPRFTPAILSLTEELTPVANLPTIANVIDRQPDVVLDLSHVSLLNDSLLLPVFKPILLRLSLPKPPGAGSLIENAEVTIPDPPDVAAIDTAMATALGNLPAVDTAHANAPALTLPSPLGQAVMDDLRTRLQGVTESVTALQQAYDTYWHSMLAFSNLPRYDIPECTLDDGSTVALQRLQCCGWKQIPCVPEMDLVPMTARVGSRPMIQVKEDYDDRSAPRTDPTDCPDDSPACISPPAESTPKYPQWNGFAPEDRGGGAVDTLRSEIRNLTLPEPLGSANLPQDFLDFDLDELPASLELYSPIDLFPE